MVRGTSAAVAGIGNSKNKSSSNQGGSNCSGRCNTVIRDGEHPVFRPVGAFDLQAGSRVPILNMEKKTRRSKEEPVWKQGDASSFCNNHTLLQ